MIVSNLLETARKAYLNDPAANKYTNSVLLEHLKTAYNELETALEANDIGTKNAIAPLKVISIGIKEYNPLPIDYMWPVRLEERLSGSTDLYQSMEKRTWEPQTAQTDSLLYWVDRLDKILFVGATTARDVILYYQRMFPALNSATDRVLGKAEMFLYAKTAALAFIFIDQNLTLAEQADNIAQKNLNDVINIQVKKRQSQPTRRRPFRPFR